jgi:putative transposase
MRYRRALVPGATYFFTLNLQNRQSNLLIDCIDDLRFAFRKVQQGHPFYIDAIVILPDHAHMIMTLIPNDIDYSKRLSLIKATFCRQIEPYETISTSRQRKRERGIWQRRFWEHMIRDASDYEHHINYIHYNPVKHGYVKNPSDWPYSSIHRFIREGILSAQWACSDYFKEPLFGE